MKHKESYVSNKKLRTMLVVTEAKVGKNQDVFASHNSSNNTINLDQACLCSTMFPESKS